MAAVKAPNPHGAVGPRDVPLAGRLAFGALLAICPAVSLWALWRAVAWGDGLRGELGPRYVPVVAGLYIASSLGLWALARELAGRRAAGPSPAALRLFFCVVVLFLFVHALSLQPYRPLVATLAAGMAAGAYSLAALVRPLAARAARTLRPADLLLTSACVALLGSEGGLRALHAFRPQSLLASSDQGAMRFIAAKIGRAGESRLGFPLNSRGHYDHELGAREPGKRLVVAIADSFGLGVVPLPLHFTSVAEDELGGRGVCEVYNMGVPGVGPPEYVELLTHEALLLRPDLVVVCLFVGNDLVFGRPFDEPPEPGAWALDRERSLLALLVTRVRRVAAERARAAAEGAGAGHIQGSDAELDEVVDTVEEARAAFPWVVDPSLERASFSERGFSDIERSRAHNVCRADRALGPALFQEMEKMIAAAGETPLAFLLIPDEFQVEDDVWAVVSGGGETMDRFLPQRRLGDWCAGRGVDLIDPLDEFLAAEPLADGRRHLYQARDTHWNARGNRIGGEALARYVRDRLGL